MAQWSRDPCAMLRTSMSVSGTGSFTWASFGITSTRRNFSKMPDAHRVLEICGEGRTDIGNIVSPPESRTEPQPPTQGVVPVLLHKLCGEPATMRVVRRAVPHLQGKRLWQKVKFAKQTALYNRSAGAVFVMDSRWDWLSRCHGAGQSRFEGPSSRRMVLPLVLTQAAIWSCRC